MSKAKATKSVSGTPADPTLPKSPITIDGKEYNLCFTFDALAQAEYAINREGYSINLLAALPVLNMANTRVLFAAGLRTFHPEISFPDAIKMVNLSNVYVIADMVAQSWQAALPAPEPEAETATKNVEGA